MFFNKNMKMKNSPCSALYCPAPATGKTGHGSGPERSGRQLMPGKRQREDRKKFSWKNPKKRAGIVSIPGRIPCGFSARVREGTDRHGYISPFYTVFGILRKPAGSTVNPTGSQYSYTPLFPLEVTTEKQQLEPKKPSFGCAR